MTNGLVKLAGYFAVLLAADMLAPSLYQGNLTAMAVTVLILTGTGLIADMTIVPRLGNLPSLLMGFPGMAIIIWLTAQFFPATHVTIWAALFVALFLGPIEYVLHRFVLQSVFRSSR